MEYERSKERNVATADQTNQPFGATKWGTHRGYFIAVDSKVPIDPERMAKAFEETVDRHGSFRTTFHWDEEKGKLLQTIHPSVDVHNTSIVDLSGEQNAYKKAYDMSLANNVDPNFSLSKLPLISFVVFTLGSGMYAFNIVVHHIVTDETSLEIFLRDLLQLYTHGPGSLPPVQLHYSDFSDWLLRTANRRTELRDEQLKYWSQKLDGVQPLTLTIAAPSEVEQSPASQIKAQIGPFSLKRYNDYIATTPVTPFTAFFAAYNLLLYKYSTQKSFVVGAGISQRPMSQFQEVVGPFTDVLPIRTTIEEETTFAEYLETFHHDLAADLSNDDVTLEDIVSHTKTSSQDHPHIKHLFAPGGPNVRIANHCGASDIAAAAVSLPNGGEIYEFLFTAHHETGEVTLRFDEGIYTKGAARRFLDAYRSLIDTLGRDPHVKIGDIPAFGDKERYRLSREFPACGPISLVEDKSHQPAKVQAKRTIATVQLHPFTCCTCLLSN